MSQWRCAALLAQHVQKGAGLARTTPTYLYSSAETADLDKIQGKAGGQEVSLWKLHRTPPHTQRALLESGWAARKKGVAMSVSLRRCLPHCIGTPGSEFAIKIKPQLSGMPRFNTSLSTRLQLTCAILGVLRFGAGGPAYFLFRSDGSLVWLEGGNLTDVRLAAPSNVSSYTQRPLSITGQSHNTVEYCIYTSTLNHVHLHMLQLRKYISYT